MRYGKVIKKGEELGYFTFGGSSIIIGFESEKIRFCNDLRQKSMDRTATNVEVGMELGTAT